jgi:hypothetical protein
MPTKIEFCQTMMRIFLCLSFDLRSAMSDAQRLNA